MRWRTTCANSPPPTAPRGCDTRLGVYTGGMGKPMNVVERSGLFETWSVRLGAHQEVRSMRKWLTPRGWSADGRTLGLGLATAMEKQRQDTARKADEYLREQPVKSSRVTV